MFGLKRKGQVKSVEEFLRGQDGGTPSKESGVSTEQTVAPKAKRWFVAPAVVVGCLLVLLFVAFVKINDLASEVAQMKRHIDAAPVEGVKAQVATIGAAVEKSGVETEQLKVDIARLEKELTTMRSMNARRPRADVSAKKPSAGKKKPTRPLSRRT